MVDEPFDRVELEEALRHINQARAAGADDRERVKALLRGLEGILQASATGDARGRDGGKALEDLEALLTGAGGDADTSGLRTFLGPILERLIEALLDHPERRLATYGSLQPAEENHDQIADLVGGWCDGEVRGILYSEGGPATRGYPALVWDPDADRVPLRMFESAALSRHWDRLDAFEGSGYRRILVPVETRGGVLVANLYALSEERS